MRKTNWMLVAAALASAVPASAETFRVVAGREGNLVRFESKATVERFTGVTSDVTGTVTLEPGRVDAIEIEMEVDLRTFDTGIALRNRHMRENHLETDRFPVARFTGGTLVEGAGQSLDPGAAVHVLVEGELDLHGVSRTVRIPLDLVYDGVGLRIAGRFSVALSDHDIARPKFLVLKLADVQEVVVDVTAEPE